MPAAPPPHDPRRWPPPLARFRLPPSPSDPLLCPPPATDRTTDGRARRLCTTALCRYAGLAAGRGGSRNGGRARRGWVGSPAFCNPGGAIQDGFPAAMLDDTLGPRVFVKSGGTDCCATTDLNVGDLAPARPGPFTGVGRIVRTGRTIDASRGPPLPHGSCRRRAYRALDVGVCTSRSTEKHPRDYAALRAAAKLPA